DARHEPGEIRTPGPRAAARRDELELEAFADRQQCRRSVGEGKVELASRQRWKKRRATGRRRRVDLKTLITEKALSDADHEWSGIDDRDGADADLRQGLRSHSRAPSADTPIAAPMPARNALRDRDIEPSNLKALSIILHPNQF